MAGNRILEQRFELLDREAGVTNNRRHGVGIDGVIARHNDFCFAFRQEDVFALPIDAKACFFQRFHGAKMIDAGKLRHSSGRADIHLANLTTGFGFAIEFEVAFDRVFDVDQGFLDIASLRMASR